MICPSCLSDGIEVRYDVKNRPYIVHLWCQTRLFLRSESVLACLLDKQAGIARWVESSGGPVAMQAQAARPADPGVAPTAECRCNVCLIPGAAMLRFDKKQRPYTLCRACGARGFVGHAVGLTAIRLTTPGVRVFMALALGGMDVGRDSQREAAPAVAGAGAA